MLVGAIIHFWGILHGLADGLIYHADAHLAGVAAPGICTSAGPFGRQVRRGARVPQLARARDRNDARGAGRRDYPPEWTFGLVGSVLALP